MTSALVLGGASSLWDDLEQLEQLVGGPWPHTTIAVNDSGWAYARPIDHWVSLHAEKLAGWMEMREARELSMDFETWGGTWRTNRDDSHLVDHVLPVTLVGSSGMHAVNVALHLGAERVVLAGVPMDFRPHFFDTRSWDSAMAHQEAWTAAAGDYRDRVRSLSGWSADLLGTPDIAWLSADLS